MKEIDFNIFVIVENWKEITDSSIDYSSIRVHLAIKFYAAVLNRMEEFYPSGALPGAILSLPPGTIYLDSLVVATREGVC